MDAGWIDFARVETAVLLRIPLWLETVAAIRECLPMRPRWKPFDYTRELTTSARRGLAGDRPVAFRERPHHRRGYEAYHAGDIMRG